ncbi:MAG: PASTA domain-containing protein [Clostridia bacterium]|jgi:beta-lactam-binding protein with PASTA domain|nr:PASTA domain-containing protein [Clostridia bacterium]
MIGGLSWKWSVNVAIQIASALETAHKNNIIHRDIKPHNIIITEEGIAKVTDFGIAKAVSNSTITAFGATIGSVHYFSPEHARGGYTDAKSDLYSLGIVMYEMLTKRVPFDADTPVSIALMHMQETAIEPIKLNPAIPKSVNKIIIKAMQKDPNLRYKTAADMLNDLRLALRNPDEDFVEISPDKSNFATQRIPTMYNNQIEYENEEDGEEEEAEGFIKRHKVIVSIVGIILVFIITILITYFTLKMTAVKEVQIPNVVNISAQEAKQKVEELKLVYTELEPEFSPDIPEGYIIKQEPAYLDNYTVKENSEVKVTISKGQEIAIVPKVIGKTKEEAIEELEEANLKAQVIEETNAKIPEGVVISQETEAKTQVNAGETIKIHVSTGVEQVTVPNVVGKTEEEAKKAITDAKLKLKQVIQTDDPTKEDGKIVKQDLNSGTTVNEGTEITITLNKVPQQKTATVKVNVKSLLNGKVEYEKTDENTVGAPKVKKVKLEIKVGEDVVRSEEVDPTSTNIVQQITGIGSVHIRIYIDGVLKKQELHFNMNTNNIYIAE